jgi:hypothetical protein
MIGLELSKHMHKGGPSLMGMGSIFLNNSMGYSKSNQNYSLILIISLTFLRLGPRLLEHMPFSTQYGVRP